MKKFDFIIIAAALAVAGIMCLFLYGLNNNSGAYVQIEVDGKAVEALPLDEDAEREITTDYGSNTLIIKDGEAYVSEADCPDKICVHHSKIHRKGEAIICLPHKLTVSIIGNGAEIDAEAR